MGTYLSLGLAKTIYITKKSTEEKIDNMLEILDKDFDLSFYNIMQSEKYFVLDLKHEIFEKEVANLMKEIGNTMTGYIKEFNCKAINEIEGKNHDEIMEIAKDKILGFQYMKGYFICNDISYLLGDHTGFADVIDFINDGKIIMECYSELFYCFRTNIVNALKSKLKKSVVITIIG